MTLPAVVPYSSLLTHPSFFLTCGWQPHASTYAHLNLCKHTRPRKTGTQSHMLSLSLAPEVSCVHNYKLYLNQMRGIISSLLIGSTNTQAANKTANTMPLCRNKPDRRGVKYSAWKTNKLVCYQSLSIHSEYLINLYQGITVYFLAKARETLCGFKMTNQTLSQDCVLAYNKCFFTCAHY